jgi:hypothetical protein
MAAFPKRSSPAEIVPLGAARAGYAACPRTADGTAQEFATIGSRKPENFPLVPATVRKRFQQSQADPLNRYVTALTGSNYRGPARASRN